MFSKISNIRFRVVLYLKFLMIMLSKGVDKLFIRVYNNIMDKKIKSLNAQFRAGTIERNTRIALRAISGEPQVSLAREFNITKQMVNKIVKRYYNQRKIK